MRLVADHSNVRLCGISVLLALLQGTRIRTRTPLSLLSAAMAHTAQQPVNFGTDWERSTNDKAEFDRSTRYTNWTSGVEADDPSNYLNERGETRAQELANSYRSVGQDGPRGRNASLTHKSAPSVASRMTGMSYVDENYVRSHGLPRERSLIFARRNTTPLVPHQQQIHPMLVSSGMLALQAVSQDSKNLVCLRQRLAAHQT